MIGQVPIQLTEGSPAINARVTLVTSIAFLFAGTLSHPFQNKSKAHFVFCWRFFRHFFRPTEVIARLLLYPPFNPSSTPQNAYCKLVHKHRVLRGLNTKRIRFPACEICFLVLCRSRAFLSSISSSFHSVQDVVVETMRDTRVSEEESLPQVAVSAGKGTTQVHN